jgi:tRNA (uracil-5-)-methyltransferase
LGVEALECAIATLPLNVGLTEQRAVARKNSYKRGATILLREALERAAEGMSTEELHKRCVTDPKEVISEQVNGFRFEFPAGSSSVDAWCLILGSFFQNNNAILGEFTNYVHAQIMAMFDRLELANRPKFLVDAYCGSGLFSVACGNGFESVIGVEISADSVKYAIRNAKVNNIANASFITGSADKIFEVVKSPADTTALIIDPPRKVSNFLLPSILTK